MKGAGAGAAWLTVFSHACVQQRVSALAAVRRWGGVPACTLCTCTRAEVRRRAEVHQNAAWAACTPFQATTPRMRVCLPSSLPAAGDFPGAGDAARRSAAQQLQQAVSPATAPSLMALARAQGNAALQERCVEVMGAARKGDPYGVLDFALRFNLRSLQGSCLGSIRCGGWGGVLGDEKGEGKREAGRGAKQRQPFEWSGVMSRCRGRLLCGGAEKWGGESPTHSLWLWRCWLWLHQCAPSGPSPPSPLCLCASVCVFVLCCCRRASRDQLVHRAERIMQVGGTCTCNTHTGYSRSWVDGSGCFLTSHAAFT